MTLLSAPPAAAEPPPGGPPQHEAQKPLEPKLESQLSTLAALSVDGDRSALARGNLQGLTIRGSNMVQVEVLVVGPQEANETADLMRQLGGTVDGSVADVVQGWVPIGALRELASASGVRFVRRPIRLEPQYTSEGVSAIGATSWHSAGFTGSGVKVAIIDSGFSGYASLLGTELPTSVEVANFRSDGNFSASAHGTACAEIVHDVAPDASIALLAASTTVEISQAEEWAESHGVDVISMSMGHPLLGWADGTSTAAQIPNAAHDAGIVWVNAAGNYQQGHWMGAFSDPDGDRWHNFSGAIEGNDITVPALGSVEIDLQWDQWPAATTDYDLYLYTCSGDLVDYSVNVQSGTQPPQESIIGSSYFGGCFSVAVRRYSGPASGTLELFSAPQDFDLYQVITSSLTVPADASGAIAAGAFDWSTGSLEDYSSLGPTKDGRIKPDLAAPDHVSTSSKGTLAFDGTSAAAPHLAGAAALVLQAHPSYSPDQVQAYLEGRASDRGDPGKDVWYGAGNLALGEAATPTPTPSPTPTPTPTATATPAPTATAKPTRPFTPTAYSWVGDLIPVVKTITEEFSAKVAPTDLTVAPVEAFGIDRFIAEAKAKKSTWDLYLGATPFVDLAAMVAADVIEPWDPYIPKEVLSDIIPAIREEESVGGKFYVWPMSVDMITIGYDSEATEAAGITAAPKLWDESLKAAKTVMDKGVRPYGATFDAWGWRSLAPFAHSLSTKVYTPEGLFDWTNDTVVWSLELMKQMMGVAPPDVLNPGTVEGGHPPEVHFSSRLVAYTFGSMANAPIRRSSVWPDPKKMRIARLPKPEGGEGSGVFWSQGGVLFKWGENKETAAKWMQALTYDERFWAQEMGGVGAPPIGALPVYNSLLDKWKASPPAWLQDWTWVCLDQLRVSKNIPNHKFSLTQFVIARPALEKYLKGETKTAKEALEESKALVEAEMKKAG